MSYFHNTQQRCAERGLDGVPNQFGTIPAHSLPTGILCASGQRRQSLPRADDREPTDPVSVHHKEPDGQVRPQERQVHGLLFAVPG